jgi:hypothetical protein
MKPKKPRNPPPKPGPSVWVDIEAGPPIYHIPKPAKTTRLKWDRASGTLIIDPDQPKPEPTTGDVKPPENG